MRHAIGRPTEQRLGGLPGRDMDHVDADDRRNFADAPVGRQDIERERCFQIVESGVGAPCRDGVARRRVGSLGCQTMSGNAAAQ